MRAVPSGTRLLTCRRCGVCRAQAVHRTLGRLSFGTLRSELHDLLHRCKAGPAEQFEPYRRLIGVSRLPGPLRRLLWGVGLNVSGDLRARLFGTFGVSVTAGAGAAALMLYAPVTTILWYGPLDETGRLDVRLAFDHRVMDGMTIARALAELEEVMHDVIVPELRQPADVLPARAAG